MGGEWDSKQKDPRGGRVEEGKLDQSLHKEKRLRSIRKEEGTLRRDTVSEGVRTCRTKGSGERRRRRGRMLV